jgi:hypothetical protein
MKIRFLILLILIPLIGCAQNDYMSLSFGGIFPVGSFASYGDLQKDGFSLHGFAGEYSGAWFIKKHLGLGGNIRYASNSINESIMSNLLIREIPSLFPDTLTPAVGITYWRQVAITAGPEITFGNQLFNFNLYALGGINFVMPPEMTVNIESNHISFSSKLNSKTISYALNLGIAFRLHLREKTSLHLYFSYFQSAARGTIEQVQKIDQDVTPVHIPYKCPVQTLNAGIGIAYRL